MVRGKSFLAKFCLDGKLLRLISFLNLLLMLLLLLLLLLLLRFVPQLVLF